MLHKQELRLMRSFCFYAKILSVAVSLLLSKLNKNYAKIYEK